MGERCTIGRGDDAQVTCSCAARGLFDHPRDVEEQIVDGLDLKADAADHIERQIRYASGWFSWELTRLEGAELHDDA